MASCSNSSAPDENQGTPPSAVAVAGNNDLLTAILLRLEVKPLIRFKSVSKHWLSLISDPNFRHLHTLRNPKRKPTALLFHPNLKNKIEFKFVPLKPSLSTNPPHPPLDFFNNSSDIDILQSCNGLFLCSTFSRTVEQMFREQKHYYLYNPTTRDTSTLALPQGGGGLLSSSSTRLSLAFNPLRSPHYKVVMVRSGPGTNAIGTMTIICDGRVQETKQGFEIHIYSSETRNWKQYAEEVEWPSFYMFGQGVYWNGAIHWASKKEGSMCFDVDRECCRPMPELPAFRGWEESVIRYFGESGGHLQLVDIQGFQVMAIDVFELERDYSQWLPKYRVDLNRLLASYPSMISQARNPLSRDYYNFSLLSVVRGENEDESFMVLHVPGKVISYNFNDEKIKRLRDPLQGKVDKRPVYRLRCFDGYFYSESLACV